MFGSNVNGRTNDWNVGAANLPPKSAHRSIREISQLVNGFASLDGSEPRRLVGVKAVYNTPEGLP